MQKCIAVLYRKVNNNQDPIISSVAKRSREIKASRRKENSELGIRKAEFGIRKAEFGIDGRFSIGAASPGSLHYTRYRSFRSR